MHPKKRLGQHFLADRGAAARIARLACAASAPGELRLIEVGAGTGVLSEALVRCGADLTCIEIDPDLVAILRERPALRGVRIVQLDALRFDYAAFAGGRPWQATGNLPYNVATPLLISWVDLAQPPDRIVVMIQRDVADRLTARPNTPAYGALTLAVQRTMRITREFTLGPRHFYPRPGVDSTVVSLERLAEPAVVTRRAPAARLREVIRAAFAYRRKTLANSLELALAIPRARTQEALRACGLNSEARAEQLDLADFAALTDALAG